MRQLLPLILVACCATFVPAEAQTCDPPGDKKEVKVTVVLIPMGEDFIIEARIDGKRLPIDEHPASDAIHQTLVDKGLKMTAIGRYGKDGEPLSITASPSEKKEDKTEKKPKKK